MRLLGRHYPAFTAHTGFHEEAVSVNQFLTPSFGCLPRAVARLVSPWSAEDLRGLLPLSTSTPPGFHSHSESAPWTGCTLGSVQSRVLQSHERAA